MFVRRVSLIYMLISGLPSVYGQAHNVCVCVCVCIYIYVCVCVCVCLSSLQYTLHIHNMPFGRDAEAQF